MKNLTLFLLLASQMSLAAQEIIPIPVDTTSVWRIERNHNDESCIYFHNSIYYIDGTEVKNGKEYYKIYEEGHYWEEPTMPWDTICNWEYDYSGVFRGGVRTENGKTYGYVSWWDSAGLLMDFTLDVGDTLYSSICYFGKVIESIDSVFIGGEYRKRFNFADSWYCTWMIEGVGHERGLFESMDDPFENWSEFICYGENGIPIFGNENCDITVGRVKNRLEIHDVFIYPNPTFGDVMISLSDPNTKIKSVMVTDIFGKIVLTKNIEMLIGNDFRINLKNQKPGVYLVILNLSNHEKFYGKIIKK
ncbi:MAG TPA: T9SS type A sorting domain-containing protein [candidate division Zixibacteria bacterium]|nr:T9SS type A sorting domain-containing protein [candidate division Zixibacteria bacterium]